MNKCRHKWGSLTHLYNNWYKTDLQGNNRLNTDYLKRTLYYKYSIQDGNSSTDFSFGYLKGVFLFII